jgi:multimeric flavodoxin WrbA
MKVVMIDGSPRNRANTTQLLDLLQRQLGDRAEVDRIRVIEQAVEFCKGCGVCADEKACATDDDMPSLMDRMAAADVIVIGSPTYFGGPTGLLKNFMDRTAPAWPDSRFGNKIGTWIVTQADAGATMVEHSIVEFYRMHKTVMLPGVVCNALDPGEAVTKEANVEAVKGLAKTILDFAGR